MMRLLTLLASVKRLTLSNKVPRSKTIHAQVVCLERGVATFLSCGIDLDLVHAYKGCFSVLQVRHRLVVESVLAANMATGLLDAKGFLVESNLCFICFFAKSAMEVSEA